MTATLLFRARGPGLRTLTGRCQESRHRGERALRVISGAAVGWISDDGSEPDVPATPLEAGALLATWSYERGRWQVPGCPEADVEVREHRPRPAYRSGWRDGTRRTVPERGLYIYPVPNPLNNGILQNGNACLNVGVGQYLFRRVEAWDARAGDWFPTGEAVDGVRPRVQSIPIGPRRSSRDRRRGPTPEAKCSQPPSSSRSPSSSSSSSSR